MEKQQLESRLDGLIDKKNEIDFFVAGMQDLRVRTAEEGEQLARSLSESDLTTIRSYTKRKVWKWALGTAAVALGLVGAGFAVDKGFKNPYYLFTMLGGYFGLLSGAVLASQKISNYLELQNGLTNSFNACQNTRGDPDRR